jgi:hypothetical protein
LLKDIAITRKRCYLIWYQIPNFGEFREFIPAKFRSFRNCVKIILHPPYYPHRQPWLGRLWQVLALFLVQNCPPEAAAASAASSRAALMEQRAGTNSWRVVDKMRDDTSLLGLLKCTVR